MSGVVKTGNEVGVTRCRMIVAGTIFLIPAIMGDRQLIFSNELKKEKIKNWLFSVVISVVVFSG